jgi:DnaJ like chaperone protein
MKVWGKIIGGICGWMLAGSIGLLLGIFIGHLFDKGLYRHWQVLRMHASQQAQAQKAFFKATFLVMGHIAKVDGRISEAEIRTARTIMDRMNLDAAQRQEAIHLFEQGKSAGFSLEQTLSELLQSCRGNKMLLHFFVDVQSQVAMADGQISTTKQHILDKICQYFGFVPTHFNFFEDLFNFQQQYQHQQRAYQTPKRSQFTLKDAYAFLGIGETASDADVKHAYRRLMSQNHPDKLVSKGLPEEMLKLATEKTQKIKAAYDQICEARGI